MQLNLSLAQLSPSLFLLLLSWDQAPAVKIVVLTLDCKIDYNVRKHESIEYFLFEFVVFEALNPTFSLKINNLPNNCLPKICILSIKLSNFHGVLQKIIHCDLRIPKSRELYPGLVLLSNCNSSFTA